MQLRIDARALALAAGFAAMATLAGCESAPAMTAAECAAADWRQIGYQDGAAGRTGEVFGERDSVCLTAGYRADLDAWRIGYDEGVYYYCDPRRGFERGRSGEYYAGVCPAELDPPYRAAFEDGRRVNAVMSALRSAESSVLSLRSQRDELERKISQNEAGLIASTTDAERNRHRDELIRLREERSQVNQRLASAETEQRFRSDDLARVRAEFSSRWGSW
jgi:hypothetical protein